VDSRAAGLANGTSVSIEVSDPIGALPDEDRLKQNIVYPLRCDKTCLLHQNQKSVDCHRVVAAPKNLGCAGTVIAFEGQVDAQVVVLAVPIPDLHGHETIVADVTQTIRPNIWIDPRDCRIVSNREHGQAPWFQTSQTASKALQELAVAQKVRYAVIAGQHRCKRAGRGFLQRAQIVNPRLALHVPLQKLAL
jgi:hypothetical protein